MDKPRVAVIKCEDYALAHEAVTKAIALLGGLGIKKGSNVLIKPNLLIGKEPNRAVTTHPEIVKSITNELQRLNVKIKIGDSPGMWARKRLGDYLRVTGFEDFKGKKGCKVLRFGKEKPVEFRLNFAGKERIVHVDKNVVDADYIINVPKLKTHMATVFTCAFKNMYGVIPGGEKQMIHKWAPTQRGISEFLVELWKALTPGLTIVDAIIGLEGTGPNYLGKPVKLGYIVAGKDPVAVDAVCAHILGLKPSNLTLFKVAEERGLGIADLKRIEIVGDMPEPRKVKLPSTMIYHTFPLFQLLFLIPLTQSKMYVKEEMCKKCGFCIKSCPVHAIRFDSDKRIVFDYKKCIRCFCCQELCPYGAINPRFNLLFRSWLRFKNKNNNVC